MITFEPADRLINRVLEELHTFYEAGLIDEGKFYYKIREGLNFLGLAVSNPAEEILDVQKHKALFPEHMLDFYAVYKLRDQEPHPLHVYTPSLAVITPEGNLHQYTYWVDGQPVHRSCEVEGLLTLKTRGVFGPGSRHSMYSPCLQRNTNYGFFTYDQQYFRFNFEKGTVLVQYYEMATANGVPAIPTEPIVQLYLEKKLIYETLKTLYINGEANDLERRLQLTQLDFEKAQADAIYWTKLPSFKQILEYKMSLSDKFTRFNTRY